MKEELALKLMNLLIEHIKPQGKIYEKELKEYELKRKNTKNVKNV
jgi:hypothetical protein